tara:strand:+ start:44 stop:895 length:852 start_codon:yes stop_codon:yes gene_type:complete
MEPAVDRSMYYELDRVPRPLAEELEESLARAALRKYETKKTPGGILRSAWNYAEYALNLKDESGSARQEYFQTSQLLTAMVIQHPGARQESVMNALTLSTYLPVFEKRADGRDLEAQDCENTYVSLGHAMQYLRPFTIEEPPQWRMVEVATLALSARTRQPHLMMYPTSPREETSTIQELNHDSYFYNNTGKIPIQQKLLPTQKTYNEWVKIMTLQPLLDLSLRKSGERNTATLADKLNRLFAVIIADATGERLTRDETKFINSMTQAVAAHYYTVNESARAA